MAFDFFLISGSMYIETTTDSKIRSSAQGLFIMMTNGFGAFFGTVSSSAIIDKFYTFTPSISKGAYTSAKSIIHTSKEIIINDATNWPGAWSLLPCCSCFIWCNVQTQTHRGECRKYKPLI
jgi:hypothetical protein